jgi:hypothetical protein
MQRFYFWGKLSPNLTLKNIDLEQGQSNSPDFEGFFKFIFFPNRHVFMILSCFSVGSQEYRRILFILFSTFIPSM